MMKRLIYKLKFPSGVHFGNRNLTDKEICFCADTLFSALCQEALKNSQDLLSELYQSAKKGAFKFSDGLPYIRNQLYVPKPFVIIKREQTEFDSKSKKAMKKLKFIPANQIDDLFSNTLNVEDCTRELKMLGESEEKTCVYLDDTKEAMPWRVGIYRFYEESGLYLCTEFLTEKEEKIFDQLLIQLSYEGIGGERSSGFGRFSFVKEEMPEYLEKRLAGKYKHYMALSVCMAEEKELERVVKQASYQLKKRSGFTDSSTVGEHGFRKKDLYVFGAGSCFEMRFEGDIFDVSRRGVHPVYRYAKAMLIGV